MPRSLAWCLVVFVACVLAGLWSTSVERAAATRGAPAGLAVENASEHEDLELALESPELVRSEPRAPVAAEEPRVDAPRPTRESAGITGSLVSGRVVLPPGLPLDEEVWVDVAGAARSPVARDGSFELSAPAARSVLLIDIASRMLWLPRPVSVRAGDREVLLEPRLGGVLAGTLVPPVPLPANEAPWTDFIVDCAPVAHGTGAAEWNRRPDGLVTPDEGVFELERMPTGVAFQLHVENPFGPDWLQELAPFTPGEVRRLEIVLELGKTLAGRVLDQHGKPVADVRIALGAEEAVSRPRNQWSDAEPLTDSEGRFSISKASRSVTLVRTDSWRLLRQGQASVAGPGDRHDLVLRVERGVSIEGRVRWPDGAAVEEFRVVAYGASGVRGTIGSAGHFRIEVPAGRQRLELLAERDGIVGTAEVEVEPHAAPLDLVLESGSTLELRGTVVDLQDRPMPTFRVYASLYPKPASISHEGSEGRFRLVGLSPGRWFVSVRAEGHQRADQRVDVPLPPGEELRFVLPASTWITGQVLDAASRPVARAWVGDEREASMASHWAPDGQTSDANGRFRIELTWPSGRLVAKANGHAPSEPVSFEGGAEGVVLRLREACRVEGRVLDERGRPVAGARVGVASLFPLRPVSSDAHGNFVLDDLPPGPAQLTASDPERSGTYASASIALAPGHATTCELRFVALDPVRLSGRITRAGQPLAARLHWSAPSFYRTCESGADGRFELELQSPGEWSVSVVTLGQPEERRAGTFPVPDAEEHSLALEFESLRLPDPPPERR